jgi:hypothetical protein
MSWHGSNLVAMALCASTLSSPWTFAQTPPPCAADLKIGQTISCSIDEPGHARTHRFTASVTDSIRIDVQSPVITPHLEVLRPDGSLECGPGWGELSCPSLDVAGTHSILVRDEYGSKTGKYTLSLRRLGDVASNSAPAAGAAVALEDQSRPDADRSAGSDLVPITVALIGAVATVLAAWITTRNRRNRAAK